MMEKGIKVEISSLKQEKRIVSLTQSNNEPISQLPRKVHILFFLSFFLLGSFDMSDRSLPSEKKSIREGYQKRLI